MRAVLVEWDDHRVCHEPSWLDAKELKRFRKKRAKNISIGFVVYEDDEQIVLAQTHGVASKEETMADVIQILKGTVTMIAPLWDASNGK